ncbi:hypothetical protein [Sciscionella marina]|uniref:hypothetical protein n=1 Tax=Sciscionella marina TaxID=508770 RepID=UPI00035D68B9|nr:hypothetical protein [Sciscionella marina]
MPSTSAAPDPAVSAQQIPDAFDRARGWVAKDHGTGLEHPVVAARSGLVLFTESANDGGIRVLAKDARTGATRWASRTLKLPDTGQNYHSVSTSLFGTTENGKDYAVLAATGTEGGDTVNKPRDVTTLQIFDVAAMRDQGEPARVVTVPESAQDFIPQNDGNLLVRLGSSTAVVDVRSGRDTGYRHQDAALHAPKECTHEIGDCNQGITVSGMTPKGPLVQGFGAFWVPGGWFSGDVLPPGAQQESGSQEVKTVGTPDGRAVVAAWPSANDSSDDRVWAVHDAATGKVEASVPCAQSDLDDSGSGKRGVPVLSGDGRYLIAGQVVFDLAAKKGICLAENESREAVTVSAVDRDGTGYGMAGSSTATEGAVRVSVATAKATALPEGTKVPTEIAGPVAVFDEESDGVFVYPRKAR